MYYWNKQFLKLFQSMLSLQDQCNNWKNTLEAHCKKIYSRIKIRPRQIHQSKAVNFIIERNKIKIKQDDNKTTFEEDFRLDKLKKVIANI